MSAKSTTPAARDNLSICWDALTDELGTPVEKADLEEYLTRLEGIVTKVRAIKKEHAKAAAVIASQKSRAARQARIKEAMALLEAKEAAEAAA